MRASEVVAPPFEIPDELADIGPAETTARLLQDLHLLECFKWMDNVPEEDGYYSEDERRVISDGLRGDRPALDVEFNLVMKWQMKEIFGKEKSRWKRLKTVFIRSLGVGFSEGVFLTQEEFSTIIGPILVTSCVDSVSSQNTSYWQRSSDSTRTLVIESSKLKTSYLIPRKAPHQTLKDSTYYKR